MGRSGHPQGVTIWASAGWSGVDRIDELDYRVSRQTPAEDLAAPAVIAELKKESPTSADNRSVKNEMRFARHARGLEIQQSRTGADQTVLDVDPLPRYLFTINAIGDGLFVTGIKDVSDPHYGENCAAVVAAPAAPENRRRNPPGPGPSRVTIGRLRSPLRRRSARLLLDCKQTG